MFLEAIIVGNHKNTNAFLVTNMHECVTYLHALRKQTEYFNNETSEQKTVK